MVATRLPSGEISGLNSVASPTSAKEPIGRDGCQDLRLFAAEIDSPQLVIREEAEGFTVATRKG